MYLCTARHSRLRAPKWKWIRWIWRNEIRKIFRRPADSMPISIPSTSSNQNWIKTLGEMVNELIFCVISIAFHLQTRSAQHIPANNGRLNDAHSRLRSRLKFLSWKLRFYCFTNLFSTQFYALIQLLCVLSAAVASRLKCIYGEFSLSCHSVVSSRRFAHFSFIYNFHSSNISDSRYFH